MTETENGLVINVNYIAKSNELEIESSAEYAQPGAPVTWVFFDLPDDYEPRISFPDSPSGDELGPFKDLTHLPNRVEGITAADAKDCHRGLITLRPTVEPRSLQATSLAFEEIDKWFEICFGDDEPIERPKSGGLR